jgi:tRNA(Ile)-lysidine synthase
MTLHSKFSDNMKMLFTKPLPKSIAIGVSGGSDSMALTHLAKQWGAEHNVSIYTLTVDHNFRSESADEAKLVSRWMKTLGVEHSIITNTNTQPNSNVMGVAREIRYKLLTDYCHTNDIEHLLIAHHEDDQVETFFLRLERGSGAKGLSCMKEISNQNDITIVRPLLNIKKHELTSYLKQQNIAWVEDPTNQNTDFKRNKLRQCLEEAFNDNDLLNKRIINTIKNMQRSEGALEHAAIQAENRCITWHEQGYASVASDLFKLEHEDTQLRILTTLLKNIRGINEPIRLDKLKILLDAIKTTGTTLNQQLHGCQLLSHNGSLLCIRELARIPDQVSYKNNMLWDNRFEIKSTIANVFIAPLTAQGLNKLPKSVTSSAVPKPILYTLPSFKIINHAGVEETISVPHMNYYTRQCEAKDIICRFATAKALAARHVD